MPSHLKRNGLLLFIGVVALIGGFFAYRGWRDAPSVDTTAVMDFTLPDVNGKEHWLSEWQNRIVVLNFWATWCLPCREEMPLLMEAQKRYQAQGVQMVGIAIDNRDAVAAYARELRINYPLLIAEETGLALMTRYGNSRGALPYTVVIGPDGNILSKKLGAYRKNELQSSIETVLKPDSSNNPSK